MLPRIETCRRRNCLFHFPQFVEVDEKELIKSLSSIIKDSKDKNSYFRTAYKKHGNIAQTVAICMSALRLLKEGDTVAACTLIYDFATQQYELGKSVFLDNDYFLTKNGGVARYIPCCR